MSAPFDFTLRTRMVYGPGCVAQVGKLAKELGGSRVLVVSDRGIVEAGHTQRGLESLAAAGLKSRVFDEVPQNPTTDCVAAGLALAQEFQPDLLIGLGGGSSMDAAKGINFLFTNGGRMQDYWGVGKATRSMLPMIAVPTTAGTGSEMQSFALISDSQTHVKMACGDHRASCRVAVLDPELTVTQPQRVTALTGIDALAHALETYVTRRRNAVSLTFSREAWRLLAANLPRVLQTPADLDARGAMQLGAAFAGLAIENSMLGAAHALANPLTTHFDVVHGQGVGVMLPHVIRYNGTAHDVWYQELLMGGNGAGGFPVSGGAAALADRVTALLAEAGLATRLAELSVPRDALEKLSAEAATQWTGKHNPRPLEVSDFLALYQAAW